MQASRAIWAQAINVSTNAGLKKVVKAAGLNWKDAMRALKETSWKAEVERNRTDLFGLGLWGVPSFRLGDHCAWGQDRIWMIAARLRADQGS